MRATLAWGAASDVGRVRQTNEDRLLAQPPLFIVADGMGGYADGDVASSLAVAELAALTGLDSVSRADLVAAVERANERIVAYAADGAETGMGTTISGMAVTAAGGIEHWLVFNVGDSRVYRRSGSGVVQITHDHSEVQELVDRGAIAATVARSHRLRNIVTRALGSNPPPDVDSWLLPLVEGERFLICSDGLVAELSELLIAKTLEQELPQVTAETLVQRAVEAGGHDNVSVIVVDVLDAGDSGGPDEDTRPRLAVGVGGGSR